MDLSKAFETLDHYLLIAQLHAKNREYLCSIIFLRDSKEQRFVSVSVVRLSFYRVPLKVPF